MKTTYKTLTIVAVLAGLLGAAPTLGREAILGDGQRLDGISGRRASVWGGRAYVPVNTRSLEINSGGGWGNSDLYVRYGLPPQAGRWNSRSNSSTTRDHIVIHNPTAGWWYVTLYGAENFSGVSLSVELRRGERGHYRRRIDLLSPTGGTTLFSGQTIEIRWRASRNVRQVQVQFSADDGRSWTLDGLPRLLPAETDRLLWRVPQVAGGRVGTGLVRIVDIENPQTHDTSRAFRIVERFRGGGWHSRPILIDLRVANATPAGLRVSNRVETQSEGYIYNTNINNRRGRDVFEPNDDRKRPGVIRTNSDQLHTIYPDEDEDWTMFTPPSPGRYALTVSRATTPLKGEIRLRRYGDKERRVEKFKLPAGGGTIYLTATRDVRYFKVKLEAQDDDDTGFYRLSLRRIDDGYIRHEVRRDARRPSPAPHRRRYREESRFTQILRLVSAIAQNIVID